MQPDLAGFREALDRKRLLLGEDITFHGARVFTWPASAAIDPQTSRPYDPVIEPLSSAAASAVVRCGVFFRAVNRAGIGGEQEVSAAGRFDKTHVMVIAPSGAASAIAPMRFFDARGERFLIDSQKFDGVSGIDRYLVYGARENTL